MIKAVIDTNIIISAMLSPNGNPAAIMKHIFDSNEIQMFLTTKIIDEYERVLSYKKLKIDNETKTFTISLLLKIGKMIDPIVSDILLPDESDRVFYDTAKTSGSILITGNIRHYPDESFIMSPTDFLKMLTNNTLL
jgi:putative PIN family toxin of toxin-antitoxin system